MKTIYLGYASGEGVEVPDAVYERVCRLLETEKICKKCERHYNERYPEVAANVCLACFLKNSSREGLTYVGQTTRKSTYSEYTYCQFLDPQGYIYTTSTSSSPNQCTKDEMLTLAYWGFIFPSEVEYMGKTVTLSGYEWSIYGRLSAGRDAIVAVNYRRHDGTKPLVFVLYKNDVPMLLDKRLAKVRKMFNEAQENIKATKDANGNYHSNPDNPDYTSHRDDFGDSTCYAWVAKFESWRIAELASTRLPAQLVAASL